MSMIYTAFLCVTLYGMPEQCQPWGTSGVFETLQACQDYRDHKGAEDLRAWLDPKYKGSARLVCMQKPDPGWNPAE